MPFTFAHPAIMLPLGRSAGKYLSMTGLVIGSMMPDFEYFIRFRLSSDISHSISGLFFFCLPLGMYLARLFHCVVRNELIDALPDPLFQRFVHHKEFDWRDYKRSHRWMVYLSVLIGALSHIAWDGFTHENGYVAGYWSFWANATADLGDFSLPLYKVMQHAGSFLGLSYICLWIKQMPRYEITNENPNRMAFWMSVALFFVIFFMIWLYASDNITLSNFIAASISISLLSLLASSYILKHSYMKEPL